MTQVSGVARIFTLAAPPTIDVLLVFAVVGASAVADVRTVLKILLLMVLPLIVASLPLLAYLLLLASFWLWCFH